MKLRTFLKVIIQAIQVQVPASFEGALCKPIRVERTLLLRKLLPLGRFVRVVLKLPQFDQFAREGHFDWCGEVLGDIEDAKTAHGRNDKKDCRASEAEMGFCRNGHV